MANIRIDLREQLINGHEVTFQAPCDCSAVTGMVVYYPNNSERSSMNFTFRDAQGNDLTGIGNLFGEGAFVKVILDTESGFAYLQNATNNGYLDSKFEDHTHDASKITSGTLGVANGGTGATTFTSGAALIGAGTGAVTTRSITNLTAKGAASASTNLVTANTVVYHSQARMNRTTNVNAADTSYTTHMARGIALATSVPSSLTNGCVTFVYS